MREKEAKKLFDGITNISEDIIEEAQTARPPKKAPVWFKRSAAAACLCLAIVSAVAFFGYREKGQHTVLQWSAGFRAEDYFKYSREVSGTTERADSLAKAVWPYAEQRFFSDCRKQLEEEGIIPVIDTHRQFSCSAGYNEDGSLYCLTVSWHCRGDMADYSDLTIIAGYQEIEQVKDCIYVEIDENGNIVEPSVTVTERDGILITAEGREDQGKSITFQNDSGWYQITGSFNDSYESMAMLLDWLWENPIDFSRFPMEDGDEYTSATLAEYPDAFSRYLPDFAAFGFVEADTYLTLKNGEPVHLEGHYAAHVDEETVKAGDYYDVEGCTKMHWCIEAEPDFYDLQGTVGELGEMTEESVEAVLAEESHISFTWEGYCITVYPDSVSEAWELIASLQERME